jgi:hypothetical protein
MHSDITQTSRPQQGITDGVDQHIGIRMTQQAFFIRKRHTAQYQRTPLHQTVNVIPDSDPHYRLLCDKVIVWILNSY